MGRSILGKYSSESRSIADMLSFSFCVANVFETAVQDFAW